MSGRKTAFTVEELMCVVHAELAVREFQHPVRILLRCHVDDSRAFIIGQIATEEIGLRLGGGSSVYGY
ncbi:MAG: hypothetical protein QM270_10935 [Bacillota bacterium]|nr:hypothetical protein [Bacillota bacterium]